MTAFGTAIPRRRAIVTGGAGGFGLRFGPALREKVDVSEPAVAPLPGMGIQDTPLMGRSAAGLQHSVPGAPPGQTGSAS